MNILLEECCEKPDEDGYFPYEGTSKPLEALITTNIGIKVQFYSSIVFQRGQFLSNTFWLQIAVFVAFSIFRFLLVAVKTITKFVSLKIILGVW